MRIILIGAVLVVVSVLGLRAWIGREAADGREALGDLSSKAKSVADRAKNAVGGSTGSSENAS